LIHLLENQPRVYDNYPHLLAEMFGYSLAAAHLNLPHRVAEGFMVSEPVSGAEGWKVIDEMDPKERICKDFPYNDLPHVVHYCQRYLLGKWFILKYRLRGDFISCESPLLMEPPPSIVEKNYQISPDGSIALLQKPVFGRRHAFMLCTLIPGLNEAATFFKDHHCEGKGNYNKTYIFHKKIEE
jgi:peptidyl serine alpha-galactosyltransferase